MALRSLPHERQRCLCAGPIAQLPDSIRMLAEKRLHVDFFPVRSNIERLAGRGVAVDDAVVGIDRDERVPDVFDSA